MITYVRSVPLHRWHRRIAIGLMLLVVPHIVIVMAAGWPTPLVNAHMLATVTLLILAKMESQAQARRSSTRSTKSLTDAAQR